MTMNFKPGRWNHHVDVTDFVKTNITPYVGNASFLTGPTERTKAVWNKCLEALAEERANNGVRSLDPSTVSTITSFAPGYIDKNNEVIVGLQTDEVLRRAIKPFGGIKVVEKACRENGTEVDPKVKDIFTHYRKTHNDGVFDAYTEEIRSFRSLGFLTGLPDNYARGRIIGDYRRLALYGLDRLIEAKQDDLRHLTSPMTDERIRLREEVMEQIKALKEIKILGEQYGLDLSRPAETAQEAVQWVYMAYLAAVKEQDGAAMSLGNVSSFLDIYIEYDLAHGTLDEAHAQELIDQFVIKLRMVRHLRMQAYTDIFAGDPTWVTESIGGRFNDGRVKVTKTSFRFLQTLYNLGPSPEPNLTVLWSPQLPEGFKDFCAQVSIDTSSIQYENDDLMREVRGSDDYGIACCVSYQDIGRHIQFFGARCNLAKALLLAINGGRCENTGTVMVKDIPVLSNDELNFEEVLANYKKVLKEMARVYNDAMNIIHYMHDKYYYEKAQMAFVDTDPEINLAYGVAGMSIAVDSLSAIKYAKVKARRNDIGLTEGFDIEGEFPCFGNDDDRVDHLAVDLIYYFDEELKKLPVYKHAKPTLSILTITSNVMYGKKTGATPDGRAKGVAFAPGANPMHGRDKNGAVASLSSVAKLRYRDSQDGISNTFSIVPKSLGVDRESRIENLVTLMDGYFVKGAHHLNVNVLNREMLEDAMEHPEKYPQLTIRVSGYAVNFIKLSREHQLEVISRSFHERM
ncbi:formate C-acetyltransferase [Bacteroides gallinaceum]|uniref:Formate acetyltransferase n=2 Tax=Bacteroidaceae TaxID=815 RepID=A0ABT7X8N2_9BACE|nr:MULTISPECIES: formate C-acetyltransferase [Bacteroidaceae]CCZ69166.1 formate acetyltransferase [Bacteroides sp. CAG:702]MBD8041735.1 formate C-acetyltransferase [Phocaeicola intestinalis]MBM6657776.1 formate C-acetyltransferase [Bacteroides gallinaceum]MBM6945320.1 formate C-acetyltransferase [Bacteroides gallinaceum]MDN0050414.1 formate C-acetyltransferase [Bacteroides gallinaceum]